ncbi:hypothetical protein BC938DRAFT_472725 [Jimgerdemannia flammicorona]|uniref:Zn(2)-C6 fungal-type domain-containing protein n=1 Tax=Jimgerdemannia flammicorona TaxID=994334 RepID=A0A433Q5H6_9FUNG|nr:hypothetical protein BC938DRAFT_472725 [Jimgerdemannia flammicorona]
MPETCHISSTAPISRRRIPCESCRLRRRKCNFDSPCHRCRVSERECVYVRYLTPDDIEYEKELLDEGVDFDDDNNWPEEVLILTEKLEMLEMEVAKFKAQSAVTTVPDVDIKLDTDSACSMELSAIRTPEYPGQRTSPLCLLPSPTLTDCSSSQSNYYPSPITTAAPLSPLASWDSLKETADVFFGSTEALLRTFNWTVTIMRKDLRFQTSIHNFRDLVEFLGLAFKNVLMVEPLADKAVLSKERYDIVQKSKTPPNFFSKHSFKIMREVLRDPSNSARPMSLDTPLISLHVTQAIVETVIDLYFTCTNANFPILHRETFIAKYYDPDHPTSGALINALCARALCWRCQHVTGNDLLSNINIQSLSELFSIRARDFLEESFDEADFSTLAATSLLALYWMATLRIKLSYLYRGHALRIAGILMSTRYSNEAMATNPNAVDPAEREMFKRVYWLVSGMEWICTQISEGRAEKPHIEAIHKQLGIPEPLAIEDPRTRKAIVFVRNFLDFVYLAKNIASTICVSTIPDGLNDIVTNDITDNGVSLDALRQCEDSTLAWYRALPVDLQLCTGPHVGLNEVENSLCALQFDECSVYLCLNFHSAHIRIYEQFLPEVQEGRAPQPVPLEAEASISMLEEAFWPPNPSSMRLRPELRGLPIAERAQVICTSSAETVTALFEYLRRNFSCHIHMHVLLKACDIHYRNLKSANPVVVASAQRHLTRSLRYLKETLALRSLGTEMRFAAAFEKSLDLSIDELGIEI